MPDIEPFEIPNYNPPGEVILSNGATPENILSRLQAQTEQIRNTKAKDLRLPTLTYDEITYIPPDYLIDKLWVNGFVGFISASPGSTKTWLAWEMAVAIATGTPCFGVFPTKQAKVIAFNAEDSPGAITKARISALLSARGLTKCDNFKLIDVPTMDIGDTHMQERIKATIQHEQPQVLILDPLRQVHLANEDKASDMAPILAFLRELSREYNLSILLVCHERKGGGSEDSSRRADRTRGSNALEGWRDTAIYLDRPDKDKKTKVSVYHRGYMPPDPFYFTLTVENKNLDGVWTMVSANLDYTTEGEILDTKYAEIAELCFDFIKLNPHCIKKDVVEGVNRNRNDVFKVLRCLLEMNIIDKKGLKIFVSEGVEKSVVKSGWIRLGTVGTIGF
jgi:hypothetical protein